VAILPGAHTGTGYLMRYWGGMSEGAFLGNSSGTVSREHAGGAKVWDDLQRELARIRELPPDAPFVFGAGIQAQRE
jgi:hypothetical protein